MSDKRLSWGRGEAKLKSKGGPIEKRVNTNGYVMVKMPNHPRADRRGYVLEQILVLEKALGRPVLPTEEAHHRNRIRSDNSPGNLILFWTKGMHRSYHERLKAYEECGHYEWRKCMYCHQYDDPSNMSSYKTKINTRYYHKHCHAEYDRKRYKSKIGAVRTYVRSNTVTEEVHV